MRFIHDSTDNEIIYNQQTGVGSFNGGLGSELILNGDFASGANWTLGSGWSIAVGVANTTGLLGNLTQGVAITSGKMYRLTFDITLETSVVSGLHVRLGTSGNLQAFSGVGSKSADLTAGASAPSLQFWVDPASSFVGQIDNVSLKEIL